MKRPYTLSELLWQKMFDYGFQTITSFAESIDIEPMHMHKLMNDITSCPRTITLAKLCKGLDIDHDVLDAAIRESLKVR